MASGSIGQQIDAISGMRKWMEETIQRDGGVTLAVSLDVSNAFNSIPWSTIIEVLRKKGISPYLLAIMKEHFKERHITVY